MRAVFFGALGFDPERWDFRAPMARNARDGIFADSRASELATVTGSPASGYSATFTVGI